MDPRVLRILLGLDLTAARIYCGNLGPGSLYGLVPYDLAGQRNASAAAVSEDEEDGE